MHRDLVGFVLPGVRSDRNRGGTQLLVAEGNAGVGGVVGGGAMAAPDHIGLDVAAEGDGGIGIRHLEFLVGVRAAADACENSKCGSLFSCGHLRSSSSRFTRLT